MILSYLSAGIIFLACLFLAPVNRRLIVAEFLNWAQGLHKKPGEGIEPTTRALRMRCSTN
jgi:hypothetical protein